MFFISIEGIDGSGKTTQTELLVASLKARNIKTLKTKEPDGGWIGSAVRSILVAERPRPLSAQEEMLLISAARFNHVREVIRPTLAAGDWVVSDRFVDSTFAYQVFETGCSERAFEEITAEIVGNTIPHLTFILDIDAETAAQRRNARSGKQADDPAEAKRNFLRIRNGFLEAARRAPHRCHIIDATASPNVVAQQIITIIDGQLSFETPEVECLGE